MPSVFDASVVIHLVDRVSGRLGNIAQQFTKTQTAATALQTRLNKIGSTFGTGVALIGGGAMLAAPLIYATKSAMELQTALGRVQIATGASNDQMAQLNKTLTETANATGIFSKPKLAAFAADMYSSGITQISQINQLLPLFAKGADLMKILSHNKISPEEAAHTFTAMAHQFGRYDAASMAPIVNAAVATAPALPGGLAALRGIGGYANVLGNRILGIDPVQLIALEAAINQTSGSTGAGGRGGLSGAMLIAALKRSMPGVFGAGLLSGKSAFSAETMGLAHGGVSTIFTNGKMDLGKLVDVLTKFESQSGSQIAHAMLAHVSMLGKKAPEETKFLQNFLKTPGAPKAQLLTQLLANQAGSASTVLQLFGDPKFIAQLDAVNARIKAFRGIEVMQGEAMKMLEPQLYRLQTNFTTLASTIGMHMIPLTTLVVRSMADILDKVNTFADKNPLLVKTIVSLAAAASGLMIVGGVALIANAGIMGLSLVLGTLNIAVLPFVATVGALTVGIVLAQSAWSKFGDFVHSHSAFFLHIVTAVAIAADKLGSAFSGLLKWLAAMVAGVGNFIKQVPMLSDIGKSIVEGSGVLRDGLKAATTIDDLKAKRDENYWKATGRGWMVDAVKGPAVVNNHYSPTINMQQVKGHDHDACWKHGLGKLAHAASAGSGNSVGRSLNQGGATRP